MPSTSPIHSLKRRQSTPGALYVVATPIGNREDITLRALRILAEVDWIAAEDTRHTRIFLRHHGIKKRLISYHEHNEIRQTASLMELLSQGIPGALVSEAGTPTMSDPGFRLIRAASEAGIAVIPIPGVSAAVCALSVSGLPTDSFVFVGFLPKKRGDRHRQIEALSGLKKTLIFYESPKRLLMLIKEIQGILGDRNAALCREMTKLHEEILRGTLGCLHEELEARGEIKGECTLLVAGGTNPAVVSEKDFHLELSEALLSEDRPVSAIARDLSKRYGMSRQAVYEMAVKIKDGL